MNIKLVNSDDWIGVYINNKLVYQGHYLYPAKLLDILKWYGMDIQYASVDCDNEWLEERGELPQNFDKVKLEE